jgi:hypothetical protein
MTNGSSALDGQAFEAVRNLVQQGEYLDELPGVLGRRLTGGGVFQDVPGRGKRRLYQRGTPEHLDARATGDVEKLPALPCATAAAVADVDLRSGPEVARMARRDGRGDRSDTRRGLRRSRAARGAPSRLDETPQAIYLGEQSGHVLTRVGDEVLVGLRCARQLDVTAARVLGPRHDEVGATGVIAPFDK